MSQLEERDCELCSKTFTPKHRFSTRFCSTTCSAKYRRKKLSEILFSDSENEDKEELPTPQTRLQDSERLYFIYGLRHKSSTDIVYIGQTTNPNKRLAAHLRKSHNEALRAWVKRVGRKNVRMRIFTNVRGKKAAAKSEKRYIKKYSQEELFNKLLVPNKDVEQS